MPRDRDALLDIIQSMERITEYVEGFDLQRFEQDHAIQDAVIRRFEIIGEATKRLSPETRRGHPEIPWQNMAGLRDRVIHGYDTVDIQIVWKTVREDLPGLMKSIQQVRQSVQ